MKVGADHRLPPSPCLHCGALTDTAFSVGGDNAPSPGAITLCIECGHIMAFADDLTLRNLTSEEIHAVAGDPRLLAVQHVRKVVLK